jgi:D-amino-acid dehydrogenase
MPGSSRIVVVGGGFIGLCSALHLQAQGVTVVLIDPGEPERAASYGNAGQLAVGEVVPISGPGVLAAVPRWLADPLGPLAIRWRHLPRLMPWLLRFLREGRMGRVQAISRSMAMLCDGIHLDWPPLLARLGIEDILRPGPLLRLYGSRAQWEAEGWRWQLRAQSGVRHELLDHAALHAMEPALADQVGFAIAFTDRPFVGEPLRLMRACAEFLVQHGGEVVAGRVTGFGRSGNAVSTVLLEDGQRYAADQVVIAAGAWSHRLARLLGDRVPLESERGYHVELPHAGVVVNHGMSHAHRGFAMMPMDQGLRLAGTVELAGLEAPPDWRRAHRLIEGARLILPGLDVRNARFWMGHRPSLPDSLPIIDRAPGAANVIYAFGHGHMGLSWAATTGRMVAELAAGVTGNEDRTAFRAGRFRRHG